MLRAFRRSETGSAAVGRSCSPVDHRTTAGRPPVDRFRPAAGCMSEGCPKDVRRTSTGQRRTDRAKDRRRSDLLPGARGSAAGSGRSGSFRDPFPAAVLASPGSVQLPDPDRASFVYAAGQTCPEIFRRPREVLRSPTDARNGPGGRLDQRPKERPRRDEKTRPEDLPADLSAREGKGLQLGVMLAGGSSRRPMDVRRTSAGCPRTEAGPRPRD